MSDFDITDCTEQTYSSNYERKGGGMQHCKLNANVQVALSRLGEAKPVAAT